MAFGSKIIKIMKKNKRIKDANYQAGIANGSIKGPTTLLHESGVPHPMKSCPYCCIASIDLMVARQSLERALARQSIVERFYATEAP